MRGSLRVTGGIGLGCLLAILAGTAAGASNPKRIVFGVTLQATITKSWNTVIDGTEEGCPTTTRFTGRRTIRLRSARPTRIVVTLGSGRLTYSPALVRFVGVEIVQSGSRTVRTTNPCPGRTVRSTCAPTRRSVSGARFSFFRSARNELSFRPARLPALQASCPAESAAVRALRPGLQQAQGGISEAAFAKSRIQAQTAVGTSEVTNDLDGDETGRIVEHVRWTLTFTRAGR